MFGDFSNRSIAQNFVRKVHVCNLPRHCIFNTSFRETTQSGKLATPVRRARTWSRVNTTFTISYNANTIRSHCVVAPGKSFQINDDILSLPLISKNWTHAWDRPKAPMIVTGHPLPSVPALPSKAEWNNMKQESTRPANADQASVQLSKLLKSTCGSGAHLLVSQVSPVSPSIHCHHCFILVTGLTATPWRKLWQSQDWLQWHCLQKHDLQSCGTERGRQGLWLQNEKGQKKGKKGSHQTTINCWKRSWIQYEVACKRESRHACDINNLDLDMNLEIIEWTLKVGFVQLVVIWASGLRPSQPLQSHHAKFCAFSFLVLQP